MVKPSENSSTRRTSQTSLFKPPSRQSSKLSQASSTSSASSVPDESLWRDKLQDNRFELTNVLRKNAVYVLKKLHATKLIDDRDYLSLKNLKPGNIVEGMLTLVESKTKREYLIFREILRECHHPAVYKLLDLENAGKAGEGEAAGRDEGELYQLRRQVQETNNKMEGVLEAIYRLETKHDAEMSDIKCILQQKEGDFEKLRWKNSKLKSEIKSLKEKLKEGSGSKEKLSELEYELKCKNEELEYKEHMVIKMETEIAKLKRQLNDKQKDVDKRDGVIKKQKQDMHDLKAAVSSDILSSRR